MDVDLDELAPEEIRVLGCLIEKEATTPDTYPLTLNALRSACNQATSRDPVVAYDDAIVERALAALRTRGLTRTVHSTSNRATKYRHVLPDLLGLDAAETAVLSVLLLRGAQTIGEIKARSERQHSFATLDETTAVLESLARRDRPLVRQLPRQPGRKDVRWTHLLGGAGSGEVLGGGDGIVAEPTDRSRPTDAGDPYGEATAEFYELLATAHWERTGLELVELLEGVDPANGPIVDVGAGTGIGLPYLLAAVPGADILAIEPSRAMRVALHTRLLLDGSLRGRVTVDPRPLAVSLPHTACAVVLSAVLGHLDEDECSTLWRFVAERMPAGAPAVVEVLPPHRPVVVPSTRYAAVPVGRFTYEGWQSGEPAGDRDMRWTMTYRVLDGDVLVAEHVATSRYRCWSPDDVRAAVAPYGLTVTQHGDAVVLRR